MSSIVLVTKKGTKTITKKLSELATKPEANIVLGKIIKLSNANFIQKSVL